MVQSLIQPSFGYYKNSSVQEVDSLHLCVEYGHHYLTLLVFDQQKQPIIIETYVLKEGLDVYTLEYILSTEKYSGKNFIDVFVVVNTPESSLVPEQFAKDHLSDAIYKTMFGDLQYIDVKSEHVAQWELYNVFGLEKSVYEFLAERFKDIKVTHFISVGLVSMFKNNLEDLDSFLKIYFTQNYITLFLVRGAQLQFAQSLYYETTEDAIYQLLNLIDKYKMDLKDIKALVSGHIDEDSATWKELRKYILDIALENSIISSSELEAEHIVGSHFFTPHLHILQCV